MNFLITSFMCVVFFTPTAQAQQDGFQSAKEQRLKNLDSRIQHLQEEKSCMSSAGSQTDFNKCMEPLRAKYRMEQKQRNEQRIDARIKRLQEQKTKLNENK